MTPLQKSDQSPKFALLISGKRDHQGMMVSRDITAPINTSWIDYFLSEDRLEEYALKIAIYPCHGAALEN